MKERNRSGKNIRIIGLILCLGLLLLFAGSALADMPADEPVFLKLEGVTGPSADPRFTGCFEVLDFSLESEWNRFAYMTTLTFSYVPGSSGSPLAQYSNTKKIIPSGQCHSDKNDEKEHWNQTSSRLLFYYKICKIVLTSRAKCAAAFTTE